MKIDVEISFSFKRDLPPRIHLELPVGADVLAALRTLVRRFPQIEGRIFSPDGKIHRHINALVNGGNVSGKRGFATVLHNGDRLTILPPVGGG